MMRELQRLRRNIEHGAPKGCTPYDRYAYNAFASQAAFYVFHGKAEQDRQEATRLKAKAISISEAMRVQ